MLGKWRRKRKTKSLVPKRWVKEEEMTTSTVYTVCSL
jgi:hypothetical protein